MAAKDIGNLLYQSAVVGGFSVGYSMVAERALKMKPADLGQLDLEGNKTRWNCSTCPLDTGHASQAGHYPS